MVFKKYLISGVLLSAFFLVNPLWIQTAFGQASTGAGSSSSGTTEKSFNQKLKEELLKPIDTCTVLPGSLGCATKDTSGTPSTNDSKPKSLNDFINNIIEIMLKFLASVGIAVAMYGGVRAMTGGGDVAMKKGVSALTSAVIGIVLVLISYTAITFVQSVISGVGGKTSSTSSSSSSSSDSGKAPAEGKSPTTTPSTSNPNPPLNTIPPNTLDSPIPGRPNPFPSPVPNDGGAPGAQNG